MQLNRDNLNRDNLNCGNLNCGDFNNGDFKMLWLRDDLSMPAGDTFTITVGGTTSAPLHFDATRNDVCQAFAGAFFGEIERLGFQRPKRRGTLADYEPTHGSPTSE